MNRGLPLLLLALVSCQTVTPPSKPPGINFATDPAILRGVWTGSVAGQALRLDLTATYDTETQYTVSGTGSLDAQTLTVTGSVFGASMHTYLRPQLSPIPETATLTLQRVGQADLSLRCTSYRSAAVSESWLWNCYRIGDYPNFFTLSKGTP